MNMKNTKAAVLTEIGKDLQIMDLIIPELKPGQVLVEVVYSGICHTQLHEIEGNKGEDKYIPHTLGHEGSGIVLQTGEGVTKVQNGDPVVLSWIKGSGADIGSSVYQSSFGSINSGAISTFMKYSIISENRITKIPSNMPLKEAALLGCALPTGAGIVLNTLAMKPGRSIAIFGVGGIGLSAVIGAGLLYGNPIIAVDVNDEKLLLAKECGATHIVNALKEDPYQHILSITGGKGVDYAIEAAGTVQTMETAFSSVIAPGGICVIAGNLPQGRTISIDPFDLIKGKKILGTWGGETDPDRDIPFYVDMYNRGLLKIDKLITHLYPLSQINEAFNDLKNRRVGRGMIDLSL